jgi:hypothetical protein
MIDNIEFILYPIISKFIVFLYIGVRHEAVFLLLYTGKDYHYSPLYHEYHFSYNLVYGEVCYP